MREVEHVFANESLLDLFIGPVDEQLVIEVCLLSQASGEVNWVLEASTIPIRLKQNAKFLGPT